MAAGMILLLLLLVCGLVLAVGEFFFSFHSSFCLFSGFWFLVCFFVVLKIFPSLALTPVLSFLRFLLYDSE